MDAINKEKVDKILAKFDSYKRKCGEIKIVTSGETSVIDSKFGGMAYIPRSVGSPPMNEADEAFILLAQFNLEQVPAGIFSASNGILQFFIDNDDDLYGADYDDWTDDLGYKVIFYPEIAEDYLSREEVEAFYEDFDFELTPINEGEWGISFTEKTERLSLNDYRFNEKFVAEWNKEYPDEAIKSYWNLPDDLDSYLYDEILSDGHKLLGYPSFTQADPRDYDDEKKEFELLFQMDSETIDSLDCDIMWGDLGIGNFFIRPEQLEKMDFSEVAYNWDCG